jgi:uroporphyrin-3 C-methyltransferase
MSETDKSPGSDMLPDEAIDDESGSTEDASFDPEDIEAEDQADDAAKPKQSPGLSSVAWLALFLALIGVAGVSYVLFDDSGEDRILDDARTAVDNLRDDIAEANASIGSVEAGLEAVRSAAGSADERDTRLAADIERLDRELDRRRDLLDSLPPRMSSLEQAVAGLQGVSLEARNTYLVAEAEYYMQIANAQLQLAGNPYLASLALEQADDRLLQLADPALTDVRRALSDEIAALGAVEKPDLAGATLTLGSLSRVVDSLPLRGTGGVADDDTGVEEDPEASGFDRAWNSVKDAFRGSFSVTRPGDDQVPLLTPEAEPLLRSNLSLMLQAARLALLRGEQSVFEQSLDDADAWLELYFDAGSAQVAAARQTIADIRGDYSATTPPDISTSLRLLRQYRTLSEPAQ